MCLLGKAPDGLDAFALGVAIGAAFSTRFVNDLLCDAHRMPYVMAQLRVTTQILAQDPDGEAAPS